MILINRVASMAKEGLDMFRPSLAAISKRLLRPAAVKSEVN
jgi:hypothetical protein